MAALYGHTPCVELLLGAGAQPGVRDPDGSTALHDAAAGGYTDVVRLLLEADPRLALTTDDDGDTPLHNAARGGHAESAQLLLDAGADPTVPNNVRQRDLV